MPELALKCIDSWHKNMPDYIYKLWNEENFDISSNQYVKEAYEAKKYAFVTDFVRLFALYTEGGIYMDTDVEVLRPYDDLLNLTAFTGYEGSKYHPPVTGTKASEPGGEWVKEQLDSYNDAHFINSDGSYDLTTNTIRITDIMKAGGFNSDGKKRIYKDLTVFPTEYFCPRQTTGEVLITPNTYCDHHFIGSWNDKRRSPNILIHLFGQKGLTRLIKFKRKLLG
jgi:hypothetical protein